MSEADLFTARDGKVLYRGAWLPKIYAERLLARLERSAADRSDSLRKWSGEQARVLRSALDEAVE